MKYFKHLIMPVRLKRIYKIFVNNPFTLLDVGCGNHSAKKTKTIFPNCTYYGLDRTSFLNDDEDFSLMEQFYEADLETNDLSEIPSDFFDVVILSHVIEHLRNGEEVLETLTSKLKPGGYLYVEFPSVSSLGYPNMEGTLNFCDDPTHVKIYTVAEIANVCLRNGCIILRANRRRDPIRILIGPIVFVWTFLKTWKVSARGLWDIYGFASYVFVRKTSM